ncbi:hypothetical protein BH09PLA1_BH09PLA1_13040 [soil metagenome]
MVTETAKRVPQHTDRHVNERIRRETEMRIAYFSQHPEQINQRLRELDQEWDIERTLATGSTTLTLTGLLMGIGVRRKWLLLALAVQGFYLQHALQGWCPPLPLFRRMGIRTAEEIHRERYALKAIRGDFDNIKDGQTAPERILQATTR